MIPPFSPTKRAGGVKSNLKPSSCNFVTAWAVIRFASSLIVAFAKSSNSSLDSGVLALSKRPFIISNNVAISNK